MITRNHIVEEARSWVGTPFKHQGMLKGIASDCAGVIMGIANNLGISDVRITGYATSPSHGLLEKYLDEHLERSEEMLPGNILLIRFEREPQHLALISRSDPVYIIHCYEGAGRVVEHILDDKWRKRIVRIYSFPVLDKHDKREESPGKVIIRHDPKEAPKPKKGKK